MIDALDNKILGPMILKGLEQGRQQGREQGRQQGRQQGREQGRLEGKQSLFRDILSAKFGPLPEWAVKRIESASDADFEKWAMRVLRSDSLEGALRD